LAKALSFITSVPALKSRAIDYININFLLPLIFFIAPSFKMGEAENRNKETAGLRQIVSLKSRAI
jgi:hypothetical protein